MYVLMFAIIGMLIGWITNLIAIKLLFRPLKPVQLLIFNLEGVIPRRKKEIAKTIGRTVEEKLLSSDEIIQMMLQGEKREKIIQFMLREIHLTLKSKIPSYLPITIKENITYGIYSLIEHEMNRYLNSLSNKKLEDIKGMISFAEIVEEKINNFSIEEIETITYKLMRKELKHIELFGGFLGLFIGFTQGILVTIL